MAGPNCRVGESRSWRVCGAGGPPSVRARTISSASIALIPTPYDHLAARPDCGFATPTNALIWIADGCPTICEGIVFPSITWQACIDCAPKDDHIATRPQCPMAVSRSWCICRICGRPSISGWIVPPASIRIRWRVPTPHDHFVARPDCRVPESWSWRVDHARGRPSVCGWIISPAGIRLDTVNSGSTPNYHFGPRPHCCVT